NLIRLEKDDPYIFSQSYSYINKVTENLIHFRKDIFVDQEINESTEPISDEESKEEIPSQEISNMEESKEIQKEEEMKNESITQSPSVVPLIKLDSIKYVKSEEEITEDDETQSDVSTLKDNSFYETIQNSFDIN